jgi:hypothetical protein
MHLLSLARKVKEGVQSAGLIGYQFNTIGVRYWDLILLLTGVMEYQWEHRACATVSRVEISSQTALKQSHKRSGTMQTSHWYNLLNPHLLTLSLDVTRTWYPNSIASIDKSPGV